MESIPDSSLPSPWQQHKEQNSSKVYGKIFEQLCYFKADFQVTFYTRKFSIE
jgi:hypothetical protein